jgi:hypothetical protein
MGHLNDSWTRSSVSRLQFFFVISVLSNKLLDFEVEWLIIIIQAVDVMTLNPSLETSCPD